jgi:exopolysaccharide biosynthesis polyprenyl glycosylphosphotransferase
MALFSASQIRSAAQPSPRWASRANAAALLEKLETETHKPTIPRLAFVGFTRICEFLALALIGVALRHFSKIPGVEASLYGVGATLAIALVAVIVFQALKAYSIPAFRFPFGHVIRMAGGWGAVCIAVNCLCEGLGGTAATAEPWIVAWFWVGLAFLMIERAALGFAVSGLARTGRLERRAVVVGGGTDFARELLRDLVSADPAEVRLLGLFDDRSDERSPSEVEGVPKLGNVDELVSFARSARVELVIFALPIAAEKRILEMLRKMWVLPVDVRLAAHANRLRLRPRSYSYVGQAPMLDVFDRPLADWDVVTKAAFDRIVGACVLLLLSPVMLVAALAIKLDSRGPVLFRQERLARDRKPFILNKFRTMHNGVDHERHRMFVVGLIAGELPEPHQDGPRFKLADDERVTRVGRVLRRTSLDELPQLWNVLRGEMSLVGPRPPIAYEVEHYPAHWLERFAVKPGLTGLWQISGRAELTLEDMVELDIQYIHRRSLRTNVAILLRTVPVVISTRGAS